MNRIKNNLIGANYHAQYHKDLNLKKKRNLLKLQKKSLIF